MIDASIRNPYMAAVASLFVLIAGWAAARALPLQLRPTVEPPEIQVQTSYAGAAPAEVEDQITRRIEEQLTAVSAVRELVSTSSSGRSAITLRFEDGVDRNAAMVDVLNKLQGVSGLPPDADPPEVTATTSDQQAPVMWVGVREPEGARPTPVPLLRQMVDDVIAPRIRRVEGVAGMIIAGGREREVHVQVDFDALIARGLSLPELLGALTRDNQNARGGPLWAGKREYTVRTTARAAEPADLAQLVLRRDDAGSVTLGDVATVERSASIVQSVMRQDGVGAVALGVQRQTGANVPSTVDGVRAALAELEQSFVDAGLPIAFRELYSETTYIDEAIAQARQNIIEGMILAAIVLFVVLRSPRAVGLVTLTQPLSVLGVLPVLWVLGRSLNIITLAGLAFAVGITIDNAVVVIENIFRHRQEGKGPFEAALEGTREVSGAMLAATITNICVFAPVLFLQGEAGQIFRDLAIGISVASLFSLIAVLTVLPAAASRWLGNVKPVEDGPGWLGRLYGRIVDRFTAPSPWARLAMVTFALGSSGLGLLAVPDPSYLPEGNRNLILTFARPLPGTSAEAAGELFAPIEAELVADPRVARTFVTLSSRFMAMGAVLAPDYADPAHFGAFLGELRGRVSQVPGFRFLFPRRASIFQDPGKQFELTVAGADLDRLAGLAAELMGQIKAVPGVVSVRGDYESGTPELQVVPDRRRLTELGLRPADLASAVEAAVGGRRVGTFFDEGRELDLVLLGDDAYRADPARLAALPLAPGVRLDSVATIVDTLGPVAIPHRDMERAITLQVSLGEDARLGGVIAQVEAEVLRPLRARLPPGYWASTGGTADRLNDALTGLGSSLLYAVVIVYLLLVPLYRSWGQPFVILTAVPLAVCGALLALAGVNLFTRVEFDTIAILGLILLTGVVVNISILIVSQAQEFLAKGYAPRDAVREASVTRLRPILMSAFTSVMGMLPLAAGSGSGTELYRGLGVVMVGGLVLSTLGTPLVVPALMAFSKSWRR